MKVKPTTQSAQPVDALRAPGSRHVAWCPNDGTMIAIFQVPNKFFEANGRVNDAGDKDWDSAWGHMLSR